MLANYFAEGGFRVEGSRTQINTFMYLNLSFPISPFKNILYLKFNLLLLVNVMRKYHAIENIFSGYWNHNKKPIKKLNFYWNQCIVQKLSL